jgi:hypothetical protein
MIPKSFQFETDVNPAGKVELTVPIPPGTRVEVRVRTLNSDECEDLVEAASSSTDFWNNPWDDEDWNNA